MEFLINGGITAVVTWNIVALMQAVLHRTLAHRPRGKVIFRNHVTCHHRHYRGERLLSERYIEDDLNLTPWFLMPCATMVAAAWVVLPLSLFVVHVMALATAFAAHVYLHTRFHLENTWLLRFEWFRRKRVLHLEHHRNMRCNFSIIGFAWDRLMGTYREPRAVAAAWEAAQCRA